VEVQDGWQDDLEASANWRSTVTVLDEGSDAVGGASGFGSAGSSDDDGDAHGTNNTGLGAFAGDEQKAAAEAVAGETGGDGGTAGVGGGNGGSGGAATATASQSAEEIEFTGTVVQTGDPSSCWTTASGRRASRPTQASGSARRSRCAGRNETERSTPPTCSNRMRRERRHE